MNISSPLLMNPANLGNHNQLTAPLLLWCRAAGLWSFLTWLPLMLMNSDWWWVSVAHWIEWLSSASLLAREDRCMLQQASDRCQQRAVTRETSCALRSHSCYTCNCTEVKLCYFFFFLSDSFFFWSLHSDSYTTACIQPLLWTLCMLHGADWWRTFLRRI